MVSRFTPAGGRLRPLLPVLLVSAIALGIAGCGRRGQPEPPPDPNAPGRKTSESSTTAPKSRTARNRDGGSSSAGNRTDATPTTVATRPGALVENTPENETDEEDPNLTVSPQPTPIPTSRRRRPAYQVPKEPFILDPLL